MKLAGRSNFRPLPLVRPGILFRSDHLGGLDENDTRTLQGLGVTRVLDFRGEAERAGTVCELPLATVHSLAIEPTIVQRIAALLDAGSPVSEADAIMMMQDTYRGFARDSTAQFASFFAHLLASNEPTVFHCTAGKDRTGFAAALLLRALGAPDDLVMRDYLLTNAVYSPSGAGTGRLPPQVREVLVKVRPEYLQAAMDAARAECGSLDAYLRQALGVGAAERARLHALYM